MLQQTPSRALTGPQARPSSSAALTFRGNPPNPRAELATTRNQVQVSGDEEIARRLLQEEVVQKYEIEICNLKDASTTTKEQVAEYKKEVRMLTQMYEDTKASLSHYRDLSWARNEVDRMGRMVLWVWLNTQCIELPYWLYTTHEVYAWDLSCLVLVITRGIERYSLPSPLIMPVMELIWENTMII